MSFTTVSSRKGSSIVIVYPANGHIGYMICKDLVHGDHMGNVKEVLAICCGEGGMYDKLKEMGKPIKTIVMHDADKMSDWKKHMKDRHCDVMMLCCEGAPHHHKVGMTREDEKAQMMKFGKSLECAMEMTHHMRCKGVAVSTAFCADDAKYKMWNYLLKCIEKAGKKHFKGDCAVLYHNMMFEALYLNREEIMQDGTMSWPVSEDAKMCPMSLCDFTCCCVEVMCKMMKGGNKAMAHGHKEYHVTGRDKMTPADMMDMMSDSMNMDISYNEVDRKEWKRMMQDMQMLSPMQIGLCEEMFKMMEDGGLKKCTEECKKLTGRKPMEFGNWIKEHRNSFQNGSL
ncbi:hypothetical protein SeMB42_g04354 [Synchytrium endobioticum]|uniref:NmrA-like domain-containing protein n=1 Tax=Synchytrium endobioticum TaxID=286115 RepID=A0A507CYX0_9FUNG|nr:hypothetical protein SeMB42_g04354 [Synchytrium endobioticum]